MKKFMLYIMVIVCLFTFGGCTEAEISEDAKNEGEVSTETDEGEEFIATGIAYFDKGEYEAAMECFQQLTPDSKQYAEAQALLLQAQNSYCNEILDRVNAHIINKEYDAAFGLLSQSQDVLPNDSILMSAYDDVYSAYRSSVLEKVDAYVSGGQYELALEYLNGVQAQFPNDAALQDSYSSTLSAYQSVVRTEAIEQADAYVADNDYENAIKTLNGVLEKVEQDEELSAKLSIYISAYKEILFEDAKNAYHNEGYEAAINVLQQGRSVLGNDEGLLQLINDYTACAPIDFKIVADKCYYAGNMNSWELVEQMSRKNELDYFFNVLCSLGTAKYDLNGNYQLLTGTFVYNGDKRSTSSLESNYLTPTLKIYCDDVLVFSVTLSTEKTSTDFSVDLTDTKYMTIELENTATGYALGISHYSSGISDFYIYEKVLP